MQRFRLRPMFHDAPGWTLLFSLRFTDGRAYHDAAPVHLPQRKCTDLHQAINKVSQQWPKSLFVSLSSYAFLTRLARDIIFGCNPYIGPRDTRIQQDLLRPELPSFRY